MLSLKKLLFPGAEPSKLAPELQAAVDAWRAAKAPALDELHFHTRYVAVDVVTSGQQPENDRLLAIAAVSIRRGVIHPDDSFYIDLSNQEGDAAAVDRKIAAFLQFVAKDPIVTYHVPYVGGFLGKACMEQLGVNFQPRWVDLAWLLPSMFEGKSHTVMPLDQWVEALGLTAGGGRRDAMANTLLLGRIFQMMLVRAVSKGIDTAARLVDESHASSFLRRNH
jgi:DNA polymerase-3 subunit epsilon